jgi:hypothetical protein
MEETIPVSGPGAPITFHNAAFRAIHGIDWTTE